MLRNHCFLTIAVLILAFSAGCAHQAAPAATSPAAPAAPGADAKVASATDEGSYRIFKNGREIGAETFNISERQPSGRRIATKTVFQLSDRLVASEGTLDTDASWKPEAAAIKRQAGNVPSQVILRRTESGALVQTISSPSTEDRETTSTDSIDLFLADLSFAHMQPLCELAGNADRKVTMFPGQPVSVGGRVELELKSDKHKGLTAVATLLGGKNLIGLVCDGNKLAMARYENLGLLIVRSGYEDVAGEIVTAENHKPTVPPGLVELSRRVRRNDGVSLGCSLLLPADRSSMLPVVLFLTSTGAQDRDNDTTAGGGMKMALFKNLAIALAQDGIASLRCDDRGVGDSTGTLRRASFDTLVDDAAAMIVALRGQPGIDPDRIAIVGHSEGAEIAAILAEKDRGIRALGLLAASGRSLDQVLIADRESRNRAEGLKEEYVARERRRLEAVYSAVRLGKPLPDSATADEKKLVEEEQPWLMGHFRHDPLKTLQKLKIPILVAQGGKDLHVSVKQDAERIRASLERANNKRAAFRLYPELSHVFAPAKTGTVDDYSDPDLHVDLAFIGDLVKFFKGTL